MVTLAKIGTSIRIWRLDRFHNNKNRECRHCNKSLNKLGNQIVSKYTGGNTERVGHYCKACAKRLNII